MNPGSFALRKARIEAVARERMAIPDGIYGALTKRRHESSGSWLFPRLHLPGFAKGLERKTPCRLHRRHRAISKFTFCFLYYHRHLRQPWASFMAAVEGLQNQFRMTCAKRFYFQWNSRNQLLGINSANGNQDCACLFRSSRSGSNPNW